MPCNPTDLGTGVDIGWTIPQEIATRTDLENIKIYRSSSPNANYELHDSIPSGVAGALTTSYFDRDQFASRNKYYLVTFAAQSLSYESCYHITFFEPVPSEKSLIEEVRRSLPEILRRSLTDEDLLNGLNFAVQFFNVYPPQTAFTLSTFPASHRFFLISLASLSALSSRYLTISIRDFRYSEPGGVVMDIDRGAKINSALDILIKVYTQFLPLIKMDFSDDLPMGLGTIQLPLSMGGIVSRGLLNILDIFTAVGR